ncbi:iron complex transport system ATP-binding protein [Blastomonas natatoria]|uniref:Iron complex transport system ATP-binding protein n=1 Tax=Blastomonas natatoria TaxID=34015 RepID=A0A2V3VDW2_9SPHN|nr:ABC transporter ATP-binding protein [Blastomonas natatoria]PXW79374.1 iron complex transport system ATP-binding protein [Blastomonas natatoria]
MSGLAVDHLTLARGGRPVLDSVSAVFSPGRVTAVLGPNGAGKSTLLGCLAGLLAPDAGQVLVGARPRQTLGMRELARQIGLLPQGGDVHWDVDVATLVGLGRYPHRARWGETQQDRAAVARAMAATDVTRFATRPMAALSGGERARVLLARVLAGEPQWLLADEPLANLDPAHQLDTLACLRDVARGGAGVIVVLHDLNHAIQVADEILLLRDGRTVAQGAPAEVLTPERIAETYGVAGQIGTTPGGVPFIVTMPMAHHA